ncbi:MAG TPA: hypothetical protein VN689_13840 [Burkholderiales bacterium]|nr:hypothetical protein [Burkholderiales bacterium]
MLVCFAVPQEARPFSRDCHRGDVRVLVSGMGARNAERAVRAALDEQRPSAVFTCGFAGALDPKLVIGDVIFETADINLASLFKQAGAKGVRFHCADRVAVTAREKSDLRQRTGADAVEMESGVIQKLCEHAGIPCATVRAVSDIAAEDLPLDFNALLTPDQNLSAPKLALAILKRPHAIPALMRLGKNSSQAAKQLSSVLLRALLEQ